MSRPTAVPVLDLPPILPAAADPPPCSIDPELWFPTKHSPRADRRLARRICENCDFRDACMKAGRDGNEHGVWGGETQRQRALNRRAQKAN